MKTGEPPRRPFMDCAPFTTYLTDLLKCGSSASNSKFDDRIAQVNDLPIAERDGRELDGSTRPYRCICEQLADVFEEVGRGRVTARDHS
jgi:hypothetical protein